MLTNWSVQSRLHLGNASKYADFDNHGRRRRLRRAALYQEGYLELERGGAAQKFAVIRQNCVWQHVARLQRVHNDDADRRAAESQVSFRSSSPAEEMRIVCRAPDASSTRGRKRNSKPGFSSDAWRLGSRNGSSSLCVWNRLDAYGFCRGLRGAVSTSSMRSDEIRRRTSLP